MQKLAVLPVAAMVFAACSEGPTAPAADFAPQFIAEHGSINAPTNFSASIAAATVGSDVTISWKWIDEVDGWDLVSFTVTRDGIPVAGEPDNAKPYTMNTLLDRSHTDYGVANGTYEYCVEVMAKYYSGAQEATITQHNSTCDDVTVGGGSFTFVRIAAANDATETASTTTLSLSKTGALVIWAVLYDGSTLVDDDCTAVPASSASAAINFTAPGNASSTHVASECAYNGSAKVYRYKFTLTNHFNNQAGAGTIDFKVNGTTVTTYSFTTS